VITLLSRLLGPLPTEAGKKEKDLKASEILSNITLGPVRNV
jgi:hypothetical protein